MPYAALLGNKTDLSHKREVKVDKHVKFVEDNDFQGSFFISAKTGDNVGTTLQRIAADLAGVVLSKPDQETAAKVVPAQIVNHPTDAGSSSAGQRGSGGAEKKKGKPCVLQ